MAEAHGGGKKHVDSKDADLESQQWVYSNPPDSEMLTPNLFTLKKVKLEPLKENDVHLQLEYASVDACLRDSFFEDNKFDFLGMFGMKQEVGKPAKLLGTLWRVVRSNNPEIDVGSLFSGMGQVQADWIVEDPAKVGLNKVPDLDDNRSYLGACGGSGLTAVGSVNNIVKPKEGEVIYVSAAAGALGLIVVQLLNDAGCTVIASAGSDEKVAYLKECGIERSFNYKTRSVDSALKEFAPDGLDVYYENVGGPTLEAALDNMKTCGRIVVSGMISQYGKPLNQSYGIRNLIQIVNKMLKIEGFVMGMHPELQANPENLQTWTTKLLTMIEEGKLKYKMTEYSWDDFDVGFCGLWQGKNTGKVIIAGPSKAQNKD